MESLFAFGDNVVACRSALHTQETPNTHKAFRIAASSGQEGKGKEGLQMEESLSVNNNLIQELHSSMMIGQISL